jgi:dihydrofolate reductase
MEGGTEYRFVTSGIHDALEQALAAARGKNVWLGGGVSTIRQFLEARLVDHMHIE